MVKSVVVPRKEGKNTMPSFFAGQMCDKRKEVRQKEMELHRERAAKMGVEAE